MIKQNKQINKRLPAVQLLALGFFLLILVGGGLLTLPFFIEYSRTLEQCWSVFDHAFD